MKRNACSKLALWLFVAALPVQGLAQTTYDPSWYRPDRPHLKLQVAEDGVYRVGMNELGAFIPAGSVDASSLRLFENGREIPIDYVGSGGSSVAVSDYFHFVGQRNRGYDEIWRYNYDERLAIDDYLSLYTDTTTYFLTWGDGEGLRYESPEHTFAGSDTVETVRTGMRVQEARTYFFGVSEQQGRPLYTFGEGYMTREFLHSRPNDIGYNFQLPLKEFPSTANDSLVVEATVLGGSVGLHRLKIIARLNIDGQTADVALDTVAVSGYEPATMRGSTPQNLVRRPNGLVRIRFESTNSHGASPNRSYFHHADIKYTSFLTPDGDHLRFEAQRGGDLVYRSSSTVDESVVVLKPGPGVRYTAPSNGLFRDRTEVGDTFWVALESELKKPTIAPDNPSDLASDGAFDYVIISAPALLSSAERLKSYRESAEGGGYKVLIVNVQDVFDQFDYGQATPIAIRRFIDRTRSWSLKPKFFTLWGDALYPDPKRERYPWEVPSFGNASSEGWFAMFAGDDPTAFDESVNLGRIPIRQNEQGETFVDKLQRYESTPLSTWQKQVTLMAGGITQLEQNLLHGATRSWGDLISSEPFGADVTYFLKSEDSALDPTFLDSVDAAIARGTSWLAFFGHSAADSWEIVTTPPTAFNNESTLPIAISLGCFTGAFARGSGDAGDSPVYAELLVTESQNGAIAHFGGSTSSLISTASDLAESLYDFVFLREERILGEAVRAAKSDYLDRRGISGLSVETAMQYNLIGDPATRINLPVKPDFAVDQSSIAIGPSAPVADLDSVLTVDVEVRNRGRIPTDSVSMILTHTSPSSVRTEYTRKLAPFPLSAVASFEVPFNDSDLGEHRFDLTVDEGLDFEEEDETNNTALAFHTVFAAGVIQLFPQDFGLVTSRQPSLQVGAASTSGDELRTFIELDTVVTFDSPLLVRDEVVLSSVSEWQPPVPLENSRSYFWRVRVDDPLLETNWSMATFTVREDLPASGWLQQGSQYEENEHGRFLEYSDGEWRFKQFQVEVQLRSAVHLGQPLPSGITVAGQNYVRNFQGFGVVILNPRGTVKDGAFDSFITYPHRSSVDIEAEVVRLDSLLSTAETGDYVLVNTFLRRVAPDAEDLLPEARTLFRNLGSRNIDNVGFQDTWNFAIRIGESEPILDRWVDFVPDSTDLNQTDRFDLDVNFGASETISPVIGPATSWERVQWSAQVPTPGSEIEVSVVSLAGDTLGRSTVASPGGTSSIDLKDGESEIDPDVHPFLRLVGWFSDPSLNATPQLLNWYVGFESVAELTLVASGLPTIPDTLAEGDVFEPSVTVINAAGAGVDSIFVTYEITDAENVRSVASVDTLLDVPANTSRESSARLESFGKVGRNTVTVSVSQPDEREPIPYNNTAIGYFYVTGDMEPPMFEVTVNGIEYPSDPRVINTTDDPTLPFLDSNPVIEVVVTDENKFSPIADSSAITILLDGRPVDYSRPDVLFEPASVDDGSARLTFTPDFTGEDTTHTMKIYAEDAAGNANPSKEEPYTFSFRVQTEAEVESLYPYPNPMNNFTEFMFRLRGADPSLVEDMRIRVYSISGRVVREFDLVNDASALEAGGLQIGWNRVPWDGRDEDGDLLANGVYLYKVFLRAEGEDMMVNNETGIEKIAIVR